MPRAARRRSRDWCSSPTTARGIPHVAMVEHQLRLPDQSIAIQVIEGNNPSAVAGPSMLDDWRIQGYGTVRDLADVVMRMGRGGREGESAQRKLVDMGLLAMGDATGVTASARRTPSRPSSTPRAQADRHRHPETQLLLDRQHLATRMENDSFWLVDGND